MFSTRSAHVTKKNRIALALDNDSMRRYEPDPHGLPVARAAVAARLKERGVTLSPDQITLTSGTSEAYGYLFKLLCDADDEVLVPQPSYPLFAHLCQLEMVQARPYPLHYDGDWHIGMSELVASITKRTRAILLVSPNNPTGSFLKRDELSHLERLGVPLISDEVFSEYALRPDPNRVTSALESSRSLVFMLDGLSKQAGLPQWKVAWICMNGPAGKVKKARQRLELIADTYLSVVTPTQHALADLLALSRPVQQAIHERLKRNLAQLVAAVSNQAEVSLLDVEGGYYATLRVPNVLSEEEWVLTLLEQDSVYVQPGYFFDFASEAYLVLSLLTPEETFDQGVSKVLARVRTQLG